MLPFAAKQTSGKGFFYAANKILILQLITKECY
jgi:hypothetical protein